MLDADQMRKKQPDVGGIRALWSPSTGIICPYGLTIALAENAAANGVSYFFSATRYRQFKGMARDF